jgi:hypothetical protein
MRSHFRIGACAAVPRHMFRAACCNLVSTFDPSDC